MRVVAVANQKGGCGKTTTSINLAACLAFLGKKILLIDLDPQGHSTCGLGVDGEKRRSAYNLLTPSEGNNFAIVDTFCEIHQNLTMVPSWGILSSVEEELANYPDREKRLKQKLSDPSLLALDFDYCILDCPPNLGVLTYNALEAANEMIIPIEPSFFSLHGLAKMSETVKSVNQRREPPIEVHALLTLFNSRTSFSKEVYEEVKNHFQDQLFKTIIHESVTLKEAASAGQSIVEYDQTSTAFRDYYHLALEYMEREWDRRLPEEKLGWARIVQSRLGPRRVSGGILFQVVSPKARWVEIAGDFNNWVPESMVRRNEEGLWQKVVCMKPGNYRYKLIVDGEWQIDPYQPVQQMNAYGSFDSYLELV